MKEESYETVLFIAKRSLYTFRNHYSDCLYSSEKVIINYVRSSEPTGIYWIKNDQIIKLWPVIPWIHTYIYLPANTKSIFFIFHNAFQLI